MTGGGLLISAEDLAAPERQLFVSPHYDDIALSCGGTATRLTQLGRTPRVAIVFGAEPGSDMEYTDFAKAMHAGWGLDAHQAIAGRRAEEAVASRVMGTDVSFLPFFDAIYRGERYLNDPELFGETRSDEAELPERLIPELGVAGSPSSDTRLYIPLAIGGHVDHQHAFRAGVTLARAGWDVWFYEDLPYALKAGVLDERLAATAREGARLEVGALVDVSETWEAKIDAIMAYPSQLVTIFNYVDAGATRPEIASLLRAYATSTGGGVPVERFWRLSA